VLRYDDASIFYFEMKIRIPRNKPGRTRKHTRRVEHANTHTQVLHTGYY